MNTSITKTQGLHGTIRVPGDKSISHRAIMLGSIAQGKTEITGFLEGADCLSTINCFQKMGIEIIHANQKINVNGKGLRGLSAPAGTLYTGNSGTTTRLISGILSGQNFTSILSGDDSLNSRPMRRIIEPLTLMGAHISSIHNNNCAPLKIEPGKLRGIDYTSPVASAQVKSSILLAGLYANGNTCVTEPALSRNHTELMLNSFGACVSSIINTDGTATANITPCQNLYGQKIIIPGDISSASYFIAAGLLVPDSELLIKNIGINDTRAGFIKVCETMGANITLLNKKIQGGEPTADILVKTSQLKGCTIKGSIIPTLIDEIPIIAVMAAFAEGTTVIKDAVELKVKETNRIDTVVTNLKAMGGNITPTDDGMIIEGTGHLRGTDIESYHDHRIAMAFAIGGLVAEGETILHNSQCVDISYPDFFDTLNTIQK